MVLRPFGRRHLPILLGSETRGGRAGAGAGAAIYDGYQRSETKTRISSGKYGKSNTNTTGSLRGGGLRSWVSGGGGAGGRRATRDTDRTFVCDDGRDVALGTVAGWPLNESGRGGGKGREARSESEENIIEQPVVVPVEGGIVKTVKVDVR